MLKHRALLWPGSVAGLLLGLCLLAGCSGIKPYRNTGESNLTIRTRTDSGSIFSTVRTAVDIYRVGDDCKAEYEGTVQLDKPVVPLGIPANRLSRLVFVFSSASFLSNTRGAITHDNLLTPRPGYDYEVRVSYRDDIYNVVIEEKHPSRTAAREVESLGLGACSEFPIKHG